MLRYLLENIKINYIILDVIVSILIFLLSILLLYYIIINFNYIKLDIIKIIILLSVSSVLFYKISDYVVSIDYQKYRNRDIKDRFSFKYGQHKKYINYEIYTIILLLIISILFFYDEEPILILAYVSIFLLPTILTPIIFIYRKYIK